MLGDILRRINLFDEPPSLPITVNHLQRESVHAREVNRGSGSCAKHVFHIGALATLSLCPSPQWPGDGRRQCRRLCAAPARLHLTGKHERSFSSFQAPDSTGRRLSQVVVAKCRQCLTDKALGPQPARVYSCTTSRKVEGAQHSWTNTKCLSEQKGVKRSLNQLFDGRSHLVVEAIGDVNGAAHRGHVGFGPVDAHGFIDGCVKVADRCRTLPHLGASFIAGAHHLTAPDTATSNN